MSDDNRTFWGRVAIVTGLLTAIVAFIGAIRQISENPSPKYTSPVSSNGTQPINSTTQSPEEKTTSPPTLNFPPSEIDARGRKIELESKIGEIIKPYRQKAQLACLGGVDQKSCEYLTLVS
jgi:hypothetical protein